ncbi:MAG: hypothetical protein ACK508_00870 [Lysobacteraceae bacterium]
MDAGRFEHDRVQRVGRRGDGAGAGTLSGGKRYAMSEIVRERFAQAL